MFLLVFCAEIIFNSVTIISSWP